MPKIKRMGVSDHSVVVELEDGRLMAAYKFQEGWHELPPFPETEEEREQRELEERAWNLGITVPEDS